MCMNTNDKPAHSLYTPDTRHMVCRCVNTFLDTEPHWLLQPARRPVGRGSHAPNDSAGGCRTLRCRQTLLSEPVRALQNPPDTSIRFLRRARSSLLQRYPGRVLVGCGQISRTCTSPSARRPAASHEPSQPGSRACYRSFHLSAGVPPPLGLLFLPPITYPCCGCGHGGTRKSKTSHSDQTWSVRPAAIAGVRGRPCWADPVSFVDAGTGTGFNPLWSAKIHILNAPSGELPRMRRWLMLRRTTSEFVKLFPHCVYHLCAHAADMFCNTAPINRP